ncbi:MULTISPECIES: hypothetical protein [unclassified Imperialibacter]|uniref:hypothetical protein n=1 Tax=unclassified Imperialibacter TaxID=2629706 RepID=UPI001259630D|nr:MULTISPECIES: hypothetical protein [unclassified Imperialibacter]CAD5251372.1 conserved membrane hypothetical protein [Imperialibacter sp. 75]CAD5266283.1 conserved membrane hypothetical protein [Imperialibacter sp. 89]VVT23799.1 conserved membrane hypothetical protein [Imperialibacter sp. EC-SDR9]
MSAVQERRFSMLVKHLWFVAILGITLLFFLYKGISYAVIGSYVPVVFIMTIVALFLTGFYRSEKAFMRVLSLWAVLVVLWSFVRLLLSIVNQFVKPIPEGHVHDQLGIAGSLLSLAFLFAGVYLLRNRNKVFG